MMTKRHRDLVRIVLTLQYGGCLQTAGVHLMKLKTLAILVASLTISTAASADLLIDFDTPAFTFTGNFGTDYFQVSNGASLYDDRTVAIGSNPHDFHSSFVNINNPNDNMLLVNGSVEPNKSVLTFMNNSTLGAGSYVFKADVMNLCCDTFNGAGSTLLFEISQDGSTWIPLGNYATNAAAGTLSSTGSFGFNIASPANFAFRILDATGLYDGNDFALDNLSFAASAVPGPIVGAGIPGLVMALGGLVALARRRRNQGVIA